MDKLSDDEAHKIYQIARDIDKISVGSYFEETRFIKLGKEEQINRIIQKARHLIELCENMKDEQMFAAGLEAQNHGDLID